MRLNQLLAQFVVAMGFLAGAANAALINPGFEADNASAGDVSGATGWNGFNFRFTTAGQQHTGAQSLKIYGDFSPGGASGASQDVPAVAGTSYTAKAWAFTATADAVQGNNFGLVQLIFLNASNVGIGTFESAHFGSAFPKDTWAELSAVGVAPAGTAAARIQLLHVQANNPVTGGSVFFDDTALDITPIPEPTIGMAAIALLGGLAVRRRGRSC
jgi:hypothetical protein